MNLDTGPPTHWTCLQCGERAPNDFRVCWSCGATREGIPDPTFSSADDVPDAEIELHPGSSQIVNVVARIHGVGPGRRVVFNGHLDTYPVGRPEQWSVNPAGEIQAGRLYGRGAADMKGGIAASIVAMVALAEQRAHWSGDASKYTVMVSADMMGSHTLRVKGDHDYRVMRIK